MFKLMICSIVVMFYLTETPTHAAVIDVNVNGNTIPWLFQTVSGGLNQQYAYSAGGGIEPPIINDSSGLSVAVGNALTITYLSGLVTSATGNVSQLPYVSAQGFTGLAANDTSYGGTDVFPSYYMPSTDYPIYITELVGTFADSNGNIVGAPFPVGLSATLAVPGGASQLQLGVNDAFYGDNGGAWQVEVSDSPLPEPVSAGAFIVPAFLFLGHRRRASRQFNSPSP